jgi:hypothetical protein
VRIALDEAEIPPRRAFDLAMTYAAGALRFSRAAAQEKVRKRGD